MPTPLIIYLIVSILIVIVLCFVIEEGMRDSTIPIIMLILFIIHSILLSTFYLTRIGQGDIKAFLVKKEAITYIVDPEMQIKTKLIDSTYVDLYNLLEDK